MLDPAFDVIKLAPGIWGTPTRLKITPWACGKALPHFGATYIGSHMHIHRYKTKCLRHIGIQEV